jgi:hypothetical protein
MADAHIEDLRSALSRASFGDASGSTPGGRLSEDQTIDRLVSAVQDHDIGDVSMPRVRKIFKNNPMTGFDFDQWLHDMVAQGVYDEDILTDDDEWELEYE